MAGIYIENFGMPTFNKVVMITSGGSVWELHDPCDERKDEFLDGVKAISVSDHGDLIDVVKLTNLMMQLPDNDYSLHTVARWIKDLSKIIKIVEIPADKEGER